MTCWKRPALLIGMLFLTTPLMGCVGIFKTRTVVINSVCQFPGLPFNYSQKKDTAQTIQNARALNRAYDSACPRTK